MQNFQLFFHAKYNESTAACNCSKFIFEFLTAPGKAIDLAMMSYASPVALYGSSGAYVAMLFPEGTWNIHWGAQYVVGFAVVNIERPFLVVVPLEAYPKSTLMRRWPV